VKKKKGGKADKGLGGYSFEIQKCSKGARESKQKWKSRAPYKEMAIFKLAAKTGEKERRG